MLTGRGAETSALTAALAAPGLVVVAGPTGIGKTTLVRAAGLDLVATSAPATLRHRPGLPLSRAIRAPVPADDVALAAEAVRIRLRDRVLLLDDVQWADPYTLAVLAAVAPVARVVVTLRTPSIVADRLMSLARVWIELPPLDPAGSARVAAAGGNPLALQLLTRLESTEPAPLPVLAARVVARLPVADRTALAALGLLGRPAPAGLLGPGAAGLLAAGLVEPGPDGLAAHPPYLAEVAAAVLPAAERTALHTRLGAALPDGVEAARHLLAAGSARAAAARAAAADVGTAAERAAALLVAARADPTQAMPAAAACASAGLSAEVLRLLCRTPDDGPGTRVGAAALRAGALVDLGWAADAERDLRAVERDLPAVPPGLAAMHAVASIRAAVVLDPQVACALADFALAAAGTPAPPALLAAQSAALRSAGRTGWVIAARAAMTGAAAAGDRLAELLAGVALVAGLRDSMRVADAGRLATELTGVAAELGTYSAEMQLRAEALWARLHTGDDLDEVLRAGTELADRTVPAAARAVLVATLALAHADAGASATAHALLDTAGPAAIDRLVRWVDAESAWLDGNAAAARDAADALPGRDIAAGLALLTARWARNDTADDFDEPPPRAGALGRTGVGPVALTIAAWDAGGSTSLVDAAEAWSGVMVREQVRCLLGAGLTGAAEPLLAAEQLARQVGLAALQTRIRRTLAEHGIARPPRPATAELTAAEREALAVVAAGRSARTIAERLALSRADAEATVRSATAKLGARSRAEAAALAAPPASAIGA
jgi:DNA-binding CsgD family transcriptional regulator